MRSLLAALLALFGVAEAQPVLTPTLEAVVEPPFYGSSDGEHFGSILSLDGDYAAVSGVVSYVPDLTGSGEVHVLRRDGDRWPIAQTLVPTGSNQYRFGAAISVAGSLLFVGSPMAGPTAGLGVGAVHVYSLTGTRWSKTGVILPPTPPETRNYFGDALDSDGTRLIVGAAAQFPRGAAYVYERIGGAWTLIATLRSPSSATRGFGSAVAVEGRHAVVASGDRGTVYTFELDGSAVPVGQELGADGVLFSGYNTLALDGNRLLVGAPRGIDPLGAVYVYDFAESGWSQTARLREGQTLENRRYLFGHSLDLDGDRALVGSPGFGNRATVFTFDGTTWLAEAVLRVEDDGPYRFSYLGETVALDGSQIFAGSPDTNVESAGRGGVVYGFSRGPAGWNRTSDVSLGPERSGDRFGTDVAVSGPRTAVGAPRDGQSWGSVYIFSTQGGESTMEARITRGYTAGFGSTVALDSDELFVGTSISSVFVYARGPSEWTASQTLYGPGAFGRALALDGDRLLVGAPGIGTARGNAYLYERSAGLWRLAHTFRSDAPGDLVAFGAAVALEGDRAVIGAPRFEESEGSSGRVHVYERTGNTWERVATLVQADSEHDGRFGASVALSGDRLLVGAPSPPTTATDGGGVYVFDGSGWAQTAALASPGPGSSFGSEVALSDGLVLVGARLDAGSAGLVFLHSGGSTGSSQATVLPSPQPASREAFGASLDSDGRRIAVGAPAAGTDALTPGKVYLYQISTPVTGEVQAVLETHRLLAPRPNPALGVSRLVLSLSQPQRVTATVYDALGRAVQTVLRGEPVSGEVVLSVDARRLAPGLYVVRVTGESFAESATLVVSR